MNQALQIFRKDVRRLWPLMLLVFALFALYTVLPPGNSGTSFSSLLEGGNLPSLLIVFSCWLLGASVVHTDAPAEESAFWRTRPYDRRSLLTAKILFLLAFVFLPLVISGVLLEARAGAGIAANAGSLLVLELERAAWLMLPALAIGAMTRNLTEFAGVLCALAVAFTVCESYTIRHSIDLLSAAQVSSGTNIMATLPMMMAAILVVGLQYAVRRTQWSRGLLAVAVIGSAVVMPLNGVGVLSADAKSGGSDLARVRISFDESAPVRWEETPHMEFARRACIGIALKTENLPTRTALRALGKPSGKVSDRFGVHEIPAIILDETSDGYREIVCNISGMGRETPKTLRLSVNFVVLAVSQIAKVPARAGTFIAGNAGRCAVLTPFPENTQLRCDLAEPVTGSITAGLEYAGFESFSEGFGKNGFFRLSPVVRKKFDGDSFDNPGGWPFDEAFQDPNAHFVLRRERIIGAVQRDLVYPQLVLPPWPHKQPISKK